MITLNIPTLREFWRALALFGYRRLAAAEGRKPSGIPGNRDPEHPCGGYAPRPRIAGDWADCQTDGHYLCAECAHREVKPEEDEDPPAEPEAATDERGNPLDGDRLIYCVFPNCGCAEARLCMAEKGFDSGVIY